MALKVNVGVCRKLGLENYGSTGASCSLEVEIDSTLLTSNPQLLANRIDEIYRICEEAVQQRLAAGANGAGSRSMQETNLSAHNVDRQSNDLRVGSNGTNESGAHNNSALHESSAHRPQPSTASQRRAIYGIAARIKCDLTSLLRQQFGLASVDQLDLRQASRLIDQLKAEQSRTPEAAA